MRALFGNQVLCRGSISPMNFIYNSNIAKSTLSVDLWPIIKRILQNMNAASGIARKSYHNLVFLRFKTDFPSQGWMKAYTIFIVQISLITNHHLWWQNIFIMQATCALHKSYRSSFLKQCIFYILIDIAHKGPF